MRKQNAQLNKKNHISYYERDQICDDMKKQQNEREIEEDKKLEMYILDSSCQQLTRQTPNNAVYIIK